MNNNGIQQLLNVVRKLRSEEGCPWDRVQTHESLKPECIEEAAEVIGGINILSATGDSANLREELGDLLLQVVFHALLAEEEGLFTFDEVAQAAADKMIRRHPHVFDQPALDQDGNPVDLKATYTEDIQSINGSWKGKTYTVTFKLKEDEGTLSFTEKKVVNGDPLGYTPKVEREGYTFIGWYDEYGKYYNSETIFDAARDITLTGRWTKTIVPTGDDSDPALFALMMLGSLACAGAILIRLRKREDKV